jgi:hypothetical protein
MRPSKRNNVPVATALPLSVRSCLCHSERSAAESKNLAKRRRVPSAWPSSKHASTERGGYSAFLPVVTALCRRVPSAWQRSKHASTERGGYSAFLPVATALCRRVPSAGQCSKHVSTERGNDSAFSSCSHGALSPCFRDIEGDGHSVHRRDILSKQA